MGRLLPTHGRFPFRGLWTCLLLLPLVLLTGCLNLDEPPVASFTYEKAGEVLTFQFDAASSYDPDGYIRSYRWDLGDGGVLFGQVVTHTYSDDIEDVTDYLVRLTVTDDKGKTASVAREIIIDPQDIFTVKVKNAIDYWDTKTRSFAISCIHPANSGNYNVGQICDIWDVCAPVGYGGNWVYVNDPPGRVFESTPASDTISAGLRGDCDDFAVLLAASIEAIGGDTRFVTAYTETTGHAYTEVYAGQWGSGPLQQITNYICARYGIDTVWYWVEDNGDAWLNLDWWEPHPGGRLYEGVRTHVIYPWDDGKVHPLTYITSSETRTGRAIVMPQRGRLPKG